ncbi:MAG: cupredoxin domain-containing protein [Acetobacteraceae bacterium]|jgi:plastocyanin
MSAIRLEPRQIATLIILLGGLCASAPSRADDPVQIKVTLKDHRFEPAEIHVQTGKPTILLVTNEDATVEEFDSSALKVEKVIVGGHYATIRLRPLGPGRYPFMGEYHAETAQGVVVSE